MLFYTETCSNLCHYTLGKCLPWEKLGIGCGVGNLARNLEWYGAGCHFVPHGRCRSHAATITLLVPSAAGTRDYKLYCALVVIVVLTYRFCVGIVVVVMVFEVGVGLVGVW